MKEHDRMKKEELLNYQHKGGGEKAQGAVDDSNISSNMEFAILLQFNQKLKVSL